MNEQRFDELWGRAEAEGYASRLASEYPQWRVKRRRTIGTLTGLVLAVAVATPVLMPHNAAEDTSVKVYCNRTGTADQQWVDLADELLLG
jgi:ferric-dicitrate binding protein FerR (iron transport regulator)